jgi:hypothetical protein
MFETGAEITELQAILDRSHARLRTHAAAILTPGRRLTARQVVNYLTGIKHIVVGTVTAGARRRAARRARRGWSVLGLPVPASRSWPRLCRR